MDMTQEAMKHIEGMAKAGEIVKAPNVKFDAVLVPNDMAVQSTEYLQEFKNRYAGMFSTDSIKSFSEYVNKQSEKVCFIASDEPTAMAVFDLGTIEEPLHAVHKARVELERTAPYKALIDFCSGRADQNDLAIFMEDFRFCVIATDDTGEEMDTNKAIMAIRKITVDTKNKTESEIKTFSTNKSINEQIEASSNGDPLPAFITFSCVPFRGLKQRDFPMRVCASIVRGEITFNMKVTNLDILMEEMVEEFRGLVEEALTDKTETYTGFFKVGNDYSR